MGTSEGASTHPAAVDDLYPRWQTAQLLGPVFAMVHRGAPRADFDHERYDLAQLALRTVDFVVVNQASVDGSAGLDRILDHLTQAARRMGPDDPARPWSIVAKLVLNSLLNDGRAHVAIWQEPAADGQDWPEARPFKFRLLRLVEGDTGTVIVATDEAIVLYLRALQTDLANHAMALKLMVELQMAKGEFDRALFSARDATKTAQGLSASLREKLDETRRDVRSIDWSGEMPGWLTEVLDQLGDQLERDRQLKDLAVRAGEDPDAARACRSIVEEVRRSEDVWIRLERRLQGAIPTFLAAQEAQRFHAGGLAAAVELTDDVFRPALTATLPVFDLAADTLTAALLPPSCPPQWGVDELATQLLRAPVAWERSDARVDDPGELGEAVGDSVPDDIAAVAAEILAAAGARAEPSRLSKLLGEARSRATEVATPDRLLDIVWGAVLWVYVADRDASPDELPRRADLAVAVQGLVAVADDVSLVDARFHGPDLLVAAPAVFELAEAAAALEEVEGVA